VARVLIEEYGADVHAISTNALGGPIAECVERALKNGDTEMLELLMEHADPKKPCTSGKAALTPLALLRREKERTPHDKDIVPLLEAIVQWQPFDEARLDELVRKKAREQRKAMELEVDKLVQKEVAEELATEERAAAAARARAETARPSKRHRALPMPVAAGVLCATGPTSTVSEMVVERFSPDQHEAAHGVVESPADVQCAHAT
jgi:hypothetical protein